MTCLLITKSASTLILALLIYTLWRRRRGASYSEIVQFTRHSGTINSSREGRLTALPIYREKRYSVRSSRLGSTLSFGRSTNRPSGIPQDVYRRFHKQNPWVQSTWQTEGSPRSPRDPRTTTQVTAMPSSPLTQPEMTHVRSSHHQKSGLTQFPSNEASKSGLTISIREAPHPRNEGEPTRDLPETPQDQDRWSWTNSQAPPTPKKYAPSLHSSLSSLPRHKRVKSWVRGQAERNSARQADRIEEERVLPSRTSAVPPLKSKAPKPTVAQKPVRKLSKRSRSHSDFSLPIQQNSSTMEPMPPVPVMLRGHSYQPPENVWS